MSELCRPAWSRCLSPRPLPLCTPQGSTEELGCANSLLSLVFSGWPFAPARSKPALHALLPIEV